MSIDVKCPFKNHQIKSRNAKNKIKEEAVSASGCCSFLTMKVSYFPATVIMTLIITFSESTLLVYFLTESRHFR